MTIQDKARIFLKELTGLCEKHGFIINCCGCCQGPYIAAVVRDDERGTTVDEMVAELEERIANTEKPECRDCPSRTFRAVKE